MANLNAPFGLGPVQYRSGVSWNGACRRYWIPSTDGTAYYIGHPVKSLANADANGVPGVIIAAGADTLRGAIVGVEAVAPENPSLSGVDLSLTRTNIPATKTRDYYVYVVDDPDVIFECQGDSSAGNQVATSANKNASLTIAAPSNTLLPFSAVVISGASINTTQALNIRLIGLSQRRPVTEFGAFAVWLCMINQHELMGNTAGI
jgi:hypothetical protein